MKGKCKDCEYFSVTRATATVNKCSIFGRMSAWDITTERECDFFKLKQKG